jgi:hypothetical protein
MALKVETLYRVQPDMSEHKYAFSQVKQQRDASPQDRFQRKVCLAI